MHLNYIFNTVADVPLAVYVASAITLLLLVFVIWPKKKAVWKEDGMIVSVQ